MAYIVKTFVDGVEMNAQYVTKYADLVDNDFVTFDKDVRLSVNGGDNFTGGETKETVTLQDYQNALDRFETQYFNVLALPSTDKELQDLFINYTIRQRDEYGIRFQLVIPYLENRNEDINHEGIIQFNNNVVSDTFNTKSALTYWFAGALAGVKVQNSVTALTYDGNFEIADNYTRNELKQSIKKGYMVLHKVGDDYVILKDINSLIRINKEYIEKKNLEFRNNQTVRVIDDIAIASANLFNTFFLGKYQNTTVSRAELKNQLIKIRQYYASIQAIAPYDESLIEIKEGRLPNEVIANDGIQPLNCIDTLYLTINLISETI